MFISTHLHTNRVPIVRFSHSKCLNVLVYSLLTPGPLLGAKCNVFWLAHSLARRFLKSLVLTWFTLESKHSFVWLNIFIWALELLLLVSCTTEHYSKSQAMAWNVLNKILEIILFYTLFILNLSLN